MGIDAGVVQGGSKELKRRYESKWPQVERKVEAMTLFQVGLRG